MKKPLNLRRCREQLPIGCSCCDYPASQQLSDEKLVCDYLSGLEEGEVLHLLATPPERWKMGDFGTENYPRCLFGHIYQHRYGNRALDQFNAFSRDAEMLVMRAFDRLCRFCGGAPVVAREIHTFLRGLK